MVRRDPVPEILMGDPALARAAIRMAPGQLKYRSAVLTFATEDVDVAAFNRGDPSARGAIDLAVGLWCEIAFAGVPPRCRPRSLLRRTRISAGLRSIYWWRAG
ncbi:hypothetical protein ACFSHQ_02765 [Gemmobacter lanyuensis]